MNKIQLLLQNPHTTYAAFGVIFCQFLSIWFPEYTQQLDKTSMLFLAYASALAGDAKPINGNGEYKE